MVEGLLTGVPNTHFSAVCWDVSLRQNLPTHLWSPYPLVMSGGTQGGGTVAHDWHLETGEKGVAVRPA